MYRSYICIHTCICIYNDYEKEQRKYMTEVGGKNRRKNNVIFSKNQNKVILKKIYLLNVN